MIRTQIYLTPKQYDLLKKKAHAENTTISQAIRATLDMKLQTTTDSQAKKKQPNLGEWLHSIAKRAEERHIKGPKDLSTNVDKYLYGDI